MEIPEGLNSTNSPTTDSDTESLELAQVYVSAATNRGPVASMQRPHRPVFDRSANGTVVSPVEGTTNQPVRVPALVPNIRVSNFGVALPNQTAIAKPTVTDSGFIREDREPRDLKQALQYSLSLCDGSSPITNVSEERKAILNEVMSQCFTAKPISVLRQRLEYLHNVKEVESEIEQKTVIDCLEAIDMEVELTDQANDFCNKNGMKILTRYVFSDVIEIRIAALNILATVVQNNPIGMKKALDEGILTLLTDELMKMAWNHKDNFDTVAVKSLYALSCLLRGNPEGCKLFKENSGFFHTLAILAYNRDTKILKKCYYIVVSLVADELEQGESDKSMIESDPWKLYLDLIMERFASREDSVSISVTLAQVLEQIYVGYHGRSENFKIVDLLKEKGVLRAAKAYLESIDENSMLDLSQDEIEMVKTCKALEKFTKPRSLVDK